MSVRYEASLALGYYVPADKIAALSYDLHDELLDKGRLICLNPYHDDSDYILSIPLCTLDCGWGEVKRLNSISITNEMYDEVFDLWKKVFPNEKRPIVDKFFYGGCS